MRLGTPFIGIKNRSCSIFFLWLTIVVSLFLPIILACIYGTVNSYECDRLFWESVIGDVFIFPFVSCFAVLKDNTIGWVIFLINAVFIVWALFISKLHYLRLKDQPGILVYCFLIVSICAFISFLYNINIYGKYINGNKLMEQNYHKNMIDNNIASIITAAQSTGILLNESNINNIISLSYFQDSTLDETIKDGPTALFSPDSKIALFDKCRKTVLISISRKKANGVSKMESIAVDIIMPVMLQQQLTRDNLSLFEFYKRLLSYYIGNIGLPISVWWWVVYYILLLSPFIVFFTIVSSSAILHKMLISKKKQL